MESCRACIINNFVVHLSSCIQLKSLSRRHSPQPHIHQVRQARIRLIVIRLDDNFLVIHGAAAVRVAEHQGHEVEVWIVHGRRHRHTLLALTGRLAVTPDVLYCRRFSRARAIAERKTKGKKL